MLKGYCQCGCGGKARLAPYSCAQRGWIKGQSIHFIHGHNGRGANHYNWKGGKKLSYGYIYIWKPNHPKACSDGYVLEHILVTEKVLGKPLPKGAEIHHVNENRSDNRKENLVICQDRAYHFLLHRRTRALKACGHANWRKCNYCKKYDDPENLHINSNAIYHSGCVSEHQKNYMLAKKVERSNVK